MILEILFWIGFAFAAYWIYKKAKGMFGGTWGDGPGGGGGGSHPDLPSKPDDLPKK